MDQGQGPSWWLYDNGELLAWPGRYFATLDFARREADRFRDAAPRATFEVVQCPGGWQWRAVQPYDYYMAYSPAVFDRPGQARKAGRQMRRKLQHASRP
jgi:hypothetical protein